MPRPSHPWLDHPNYMQTFGDCGANAYCGTDDGSLVMAIKEQSTVRNFRNFVPLPNHD